MSGPGAAGGGGGAAGGGWGLNALVGAQVISTIAGAYSAIEAGRIQSIQFQMQRDVAAFNADMARIRARDARFRGQVALRDQGLVTRGFVGRQRAALAASGIDVNEGTALELQEDTQFQATLDRVTLQNNIAREAWGYEAEAAVSENQAAGASANATQARRAGVVQAASTIAGGATNAATLYYRGRR